MNKAWVEPIEAAAQAARDAGHPVVAVDGWRDRGHGRTPGRLLGTMWHDTVTGTNVSQHRLGTLLRDGYEGLPGPIANAALERGGTFMPVAAGRAYHAGAGYWPGIPSGNLNSFGLEVANRGRGSGERWTDAQYDCALVVTRALHDHAGLLPGRLCGHLEWAEARKVDPWSIDMHRARRDLVTAPQEDIMATLDQLRQVIAAATSPLIAAFGATQKMVTQARDRTNESIRLDELVALGEVARLRAALDLPPDPASDLKQVKWVRHGKKAGRAYNVEAMLAALQAEAADRR